MSPNADQTPAAAAGLSTQEAQARLGQFGPNEPAAATHYSPVHDLLHIFLNPPTRSYFVFAAAANAVNLLLVEAAKRILLHSTARKNGARRGNSGGDRSPGLAR